MADNLETLARLEMFEPAALAGALGEKDSYLASEALGLLNERMQLDDGTKGLMQKYVYDNQEGIKDAIQLYSGEYEKAFGSLTVGELSSDYYNETLDELDELDELAEGDNLKTIREELGKFKDEKIGDIQEEVKKANYVLKGVKEEAYGFSDSEIGGANDALKKYENLGSTLNFLRGAKFESLRPTLVERTNKKATEALAKKIKGL